MTRATPDESDGHLTEHRGTADRRYRSYREPSETRSVLATSVGER